MKKLMTILTAIAVIMLCSCGTKQKYNILAADAVEEAELQINEASLNEVEPTERKIIKQGDIRFETVDAKQTKSMILQAVEELGGYIAKDNAYDYSDRIEHRLAVRVPAEKFDLLLIKISENIDRLDGKNIETLDVTEEYIDIEARVKTKKELQNRYRDILRHATKVDEILNIEREMGNLQAEIESIEGRMRFLKDKIAFSSLDVTYYQKTTSKFGFFSKFVDGIKSGWDVFLWFIVGLSYFWVFIIIAIVAVYFFKKRKK